MGNALNLETYLAEFDSAEKIDRGTPFLQKCVYMLDFKLSFHYLSKALS